MSAYANQPQSQDGWPGQRRRRRGRGWIALAVTLIVLAVVFVVADQVARSYAQNTIASKIQSQGFPVKPSVSIKGFPFLTQVAQRDVRTIDLSASNVREGQLDIASINATASGVHINSSFNGATIDTITGTGLITFSSLASATGAQGVTITADPSAGPNVAKVTAGPLTTTAQVTRTGPAQISVRLQSVDGLPLSVIGALPDYTINVPHLPIGLQVTGVSVTGQGIIIDISGHNATLGQ